MFRPIIILKTPLAGDVVPAYIGEDAALAEEIFARESQDPTNETVYLYYYPSPRQVATPSSSAQVIACSHAMQNEHARAKHRAEILEQARARLKTTKLAEIEAEAQAEAEAAFAANTTAAAAIAAITETITQPAVDPVAAGQAVIADAIAATAEEPAEDEPSARFAKPATRQPKGSRQ